ncbi:MAG: DHH family phosphoesterase [Thermoplasmata archaeon]|nr:DHH family phosphoesterase [Thermoplasmata archaeon]
MPSGPEGFVAHPLYAQEFTRARELLLATPGRWRVIYHYDGDGIGAASALVRGLRRLGYGFQTTALKGVERARIEELLHATPGPVIVTDTGASWPESYAAHRFPVIVLDHHTYPGSPTPPSCPPHVAFVNPLDWGVDGMTEMCASTLSWLFTIFLDPKNWDNVPWALSGAIHDRQHVGGFRGLNGTLVREALHRQLLTERTELVLRGATVAAGLEASIDPYFVGLSGRPEAASEFVGRLGISADRTLDALETGDRDRLTAALAGQLAQQGARPEFCERVMTERWNFPGETVDAEELSQLQNAAGRAGQPGVGVALAFGDPDAGHKCRDFWESWQSGVLRGLRRLEDERPCQLASIQWFQSPELTLAGTQAGLAITYFLDPYRPVFVLSRSDGSTKVSSRGTTWLVGRGLDLATACREAAAKVGGEGGGHRVASGATIPVDREEEFLQEADRIIATQLPAPEENHR